MSRAAQHYSRMGRDAERFYSEAGIGDSRIYDRLASMDRAREVRREVLRFAAGMLFGCVLLLLMSAPWDRLQ